MGAVAVVVTPATRWQFGSHAVNRGRYPTLLVPVAATLGVALLVLAVALAGQGFRLARAVPTCIELDGALVAVAALTLVAGLVAAVWGISLTIRTDAARPRVPTS